VEIFSIDSNPTATEIKLNINPIILNLPERIGRPEANLYIAVSGWLSFEKTKLRERLRTHGFGTRIGYFRTKPKVLEHVYGAHYDIEENLTGHPVFHSQMSSKIEFAEQVCEAFSLTAPLCDRMTYVLKNVRVPTAQMDVFAVILQLCADHLMSSQSGDEAKAAFATMVASCGFFDGAAHRFAYLNAGLAPSCYRSPHWYSGQVTANAGAAQLAN
jgi:hypothetical protein